MHRNYKSMAVDLKSKYEWGKNRKGADPYSRKYAYGCWIANLDPDDEGNCTDRIAIRAQWDGRYGGTDLIWLYKSGDVEFRIDELSPTDTRKIGWFLPYGTWVGKYRGMPVIWNYDGGYRKNCIFQRGTIIREDGSVENDYRFPEDLWDGEAIALIELVISHTNSLSRRVSEGRYDPFGEECPVCEEEGPWETDLEMIIAHSKRRKTCNDLMPTFRYMPGVSDLLHSSRHYHTQHRFYLGSVLREYQRHVERKAELEALNGEAVPDLL